MLQLIKKDEMIFYLQFQVFNPYLSFFFYLTLQCLVSTKKSHILQQICSSQWKLDTKVISQVVDYFSNYRCYFFLL